MIKKFFKTIIIFLFIYAGIWLAQNLDFASVFTTTTECFKYEFKNLGLGIQGLYKALE